MENWSGTYFIHFSSKKSLKSSLYTNISLWKIPPYMFIRIVSALYVYNFTRISKTLRLLGSIRQLGTQEYVFCKQTADLVNKFWAPLVLTPVFWLSGSNEHPQKFSSKSNYGFLRKWHFFVATT